MPHSLWVVVDVFIGLILVYLLLGMIATALQEALAGWLRVALSQPDEAIAEACNRIAGHARKMREAA